MANPRPGWMGPLEPTPTEEEEVEELGPEPGWRQLAEHWIDFMLDLPITYEGDTR